MNAPILTSLTEDLVKRAVANGYSAAVAERFLSHVDRSGDCWLWTASRQAGGYGQVNHAGRCTKSATVAYLMFVGPISAGLHVLHGCDNPPCVRPGPGHLHLGTHQDNMREASERKRWPAGPRRPEHIARGSKQGTAKLTERKVANIRRLAAKGRSVRSLAEQYGMKDSAISSIVRGKTWTHVGGPTRPSMTRAEIHALGIAARRKGAK